MSGYDQTLEPFLRRAEAIHSDREIVARTHEGINRYTYGEYVDRARQLANALDALGIEEGDRVGTFCWNHDRHFETYFGVPNMGAQLHTINPLLPDSHIQYIVEDAADRDQLTEELKAMLREEYPKWRVPDGFEFIDEIPKTATGNFSKMDLREQYAGEELLEEDVPADGAPDED